jgi:restriction endonuclease
LADDQNAPSSEEVICVDEDKVQNGKESAIEYQDEEDDDIQVMNEENLAEKNRSPPGYDEQGREIFNVQEDADKEEQIIEDNANEKKTPIKFNQDIYCKHGNFFDILLENSNL